MSGRMDRTKNALASTVNEQRRLIEESQKNGKIPNDYSLGFANGLIFCDHHINCRGGEPKFYDRTTSIGALPKPMALRHDKYRDVMGGELVFEQLRDEVILAARNVEKHPSASQLDALNKAIEKMDSFVDQVDKAMADEPSANNVRTTETEE